jgi:hypothetical protein
VKTALVSAHPKIKDDDQIIDRKNTQGAANVEVPKIIRLLTADQEDSSYQKSGNDEEKFDACPAETQMGDLDVEKEHPEDSQPAKAIYPRHETRCRRYCWRYRFHVRGGAMSTALYPNAGEKMKIA